MPISEIIRSLSQVTQNTAIEVFSYFGKNDKNLADYIAVETMRASLNQLDFKTRVILGEGEKDNAPMLYEDEILGKGTETLEIAVDPLECTTNFSKGLPNSMTVIGFAEEGKLSRVPGTYMEQWIAGPSMKESFDLNDTLNNNLNKVCRAKNKDMDELLIVVQDRPRHADLIQQLRELNCKISLIESGSITAALDICLDIGTFDALIGTYGAPEGLLCAILAMSTNSEMKAILRPHTEKHSKQWESYGRRPDEILDKYDLVKTEKAGFVATGISVNQILPSLKKIGNHYIGETLSVYNKKKVYHRFEIERIVNLIGNNCT